MTYYVSSGTLNLTKPKPSDTTVGWSLQVEREMRRVHRQQLIKEAQAIIEGADMDGLVAFVVKF